MKSPVTFEAIAKILDGIDREEIDDNPGWWETSNGAEMGAKKLEQIKALFDACETPFSEPLNPLNPYTGHVSPKIILENIERGHKTFPHNAGDCR